MANESRSHIPVLRDGRRGLLAARQLDALQVHSPKTRVRRGDGPYEALLLANLIRFLQAVIRGKR